jgi:hypothetical protein
MSRLLGVVDFLVSTPSYFWMGRCLVSLIIVRLIDQFSTFNFRRDDDSPSFGGKVSILQNCERYFVPVEDTVSLKLLTPAVFAHHHVTVPVPV